MISGNRKDSIKLKQKEATEALTTQHVIHHIKTVDDDGSYIRLSYWPFPSIITALHAKNTLTNTL